MDEILAAILFGGVFWVVKLIAPGFFWGVLSLFERVGAFITTKLYSTYQYIRWLLSKLGLVPPIEPEYHADFGSKSDELAEHVMSIVSPPVSDDHFTGHGRVRMLFECCVLA
jgi:hypothetical protein